MAVLDYPKAASVLTELLQEAEATFLNKQVPSATPEIVQSADTLFASGTQSYREVLLGCGLARILDRTINIRLPYMKQGKEAFNGRTLDERVVNPFLLDRMIPCSKGPYLAVFRRSVELKPETVGGLRDKSGYAAMMDYLAALEAADEAGVRALVLYLLYRFVVLRDASNIPLFRISRLSLEQYRTLIAKLLQVQSGGLIPLLLAVAMLRTIKSCYSLDWEIQWQSINVADKASGAEGDITVKGNNAIILAIEVTERPIEESRVISTFNTKIIRSGIEDYLFVYSSSLPSDSVRQVVKTYFSQGHEINFLQIQDWIVNNLGTIGAKCRSIFNQEIMGLLAKNTVPAKIKVAWNDIMREVVSI